ncbi:PREDICTED: mitotic-spindle organizing protein 1 [Chinchilla lanigera]|uniref:mitotic-spindle organizing protein 1 n=1 Tax=Chinchilla lanigera TaxID=34839 RepID=UPI00069803AB|nr:PREDICTED: mitotic-spindle organizing protein 1 [Chinchilla lanigera]
MSIFRILQEVSIKLQLLGGNSSQQAKETCGRAPGFCTAALAGERLTGGTTRQPDKEKNEVQLAFGVNSTGGVTPVLSDHFWVPLSSTSTPRCSPAPRSERAGECGAGKIELSNSRQEERPGTAKNVPTGVCLKEALSFESGALPGGSASSHHRARLFNSPLPQLSSTNQDSGLPDDWPIASRGCPRTGQSHRGGGVNSNGNSSPYVPRRGARLQIQINAAPRRRRARGAEPGGVSGARGAVAAEGKALQFRVRRAPAALGLAMASGGGAGAAGTAAAANLSAVRETMDVLLEISKILNTGLDMETLSICVRLCEQGINPEALSSVIKELRKATEALKAAENTTS